MQPSFHVIAESDAVLNATAPAGITVPLSVVVLTKNEERNLAACLDAVAGWCREIVVVDSGSTDRTIEIARRYGATVVCHAFSSHTAQWNWALRNIHLQCEWTFCLDADQRVTPELRKEISALLESPSTITDGGFYVRRRQIFRGKWIRYGGYYPKYLLKLVRHQHAWCDENERLDSRFYVSGRTRILKNDIIEDNRNETDLTFWIEKHNRYAVLQATEELKRRADRVCWSVKPSLFGSPDQRTLFLRDIWYRFLPLYVRPFLLFFYRYVFRFGFLDGRQGFIFHFLQSLWFRLVVDAKIDELRETHLGSQSESAITTGGTN